MYQGTGKIQTTIFKLLIFRKLNVWLWNTLVYRILGCTKYYLWQEFSGKKEHKKHPPGTKCETSTLSQNSLRDSTRSLKQINV